MKKLFIMIVLTIILFPYSVFAKTPNIKIDSIDLVDKSDTTIIKNNASYDYLNIHFDIEFNQINDYVKYKVIVKNNDDESYIIRKSSLDQSNYITYILDIDNEELEANSTKEFTITIKYNSTYFGNTVVNETQTLTILTEDEEVIPVEDNEVIELVNGIIDTFKGKNALISILGILLILGGCYLIFKHTNILAILLFLLLIPIYTYAIEELEISINSKISINGESIVDITMFDTGPVVNSKMKKLAGDMDATVTSVNTSITSIKKSSTAPNISEMNEDNLVSLSSSKPIYMWFDSGTIYWYSPDSTVYYNSNSTYFYSRLSKVSTIENLEDINTSKLTNMNAMFSETGSDAESFSISNINNWDISQVITLSSTFKSTGRNATTWSIGDLSNWNTSNVKFMSLAFDSACKNASVCDIGNLDNWDTSKAINMSNMFSFMGYYSTTWNIGNLSNWDTSNVTSFNSMFKATAYNVETWNIGNLSNWDTSKAIDMSTMFAFIGYSSTTWNIGNLSNWDTSNVKDFNGMFEGSGYSATTWVIGDISNWNTSSAINMKRMFSYSGQKVPNYDLDLSNWDTSNVTDMSEMFLASGQYSSTWIVRGVSNWDTSKVTNMLEMFAFAGNMSTSFQLDISNWNTSSVTNMTNMFSTAVSESTTWDVKIPRTNGNGIANTTTKIFGSTADIYYSTNGTEFILATE